MEGLKEEISKKVHAHLDSGEVADGLIEDLCKFLETTFTTAYETGFDTAIEVLEYAKKGGINKN